MQPLQVGLLLAAFLRSLCLAYVWTETFTRSNAMTMLGHAFLWPGDALANLLGVREEGDSKHLLRLFFNLAIWSKVGGFIAYYWVVGI